MTTEQKYGFFKGREKSVPYFGELDHEDFDAADMDAFEKLKGEVRAQGENLSLDKQKRLGIPPERFNHKRDVSLSFPPAVGLEEEDENDQSTGQHDDIGRICETISVINKLILFVY